MSDYITQEIQEQIIEKLPLTSLLRCRSVSKAWKALIDSPQFIAAYRATQPPHLLIRYGLTIGVENRYICFVDDHTFPQQKFVPIVPLSIKRLHHSRVVGSSGGLLCFYGYYPPSDNRLLKHVREKRVAVVWNPSIRKSVAIDLPYVQLFQTVLGFGVCPVNNDPMIVNITNCRTLWDGNSQRGRLWKVKICTLSTGEWRTLSCNLPCGTFEFTWDQVVIDKFIYWLAMERIAMNHEFQNLHMIMSFNMTTDEFKVVRVPDNLADKQLAVSNLQESLVVLEYNMDTDKRICIVWRMEHGVANSFTRLFTIETPYASITTLGFKKSGEPIITYVNDFEADYACAALVVNEPYAEHNLGILGVGCSFSMNSYIGTLHLLNL